MDTSTAVFWFAVAFLAYRLLMAALRSKGDVKAGANVGNSSFYLEVKDRKGRRPGE